MAHASFEGRIARCHDRVSRAGVLLLVDRLYADAECTKIPLLIDLFDIDGDGFLDYGLCGGILCVGVADPHVLSSLLVDVDDVADGQAGLVWSGGEAECYFPVVAATLRAGCAKEQALAGGEALPGSVVDQQRAAIDDRPTGVSVRPGEGERAGADLLEVARTAAAVLNQTIESGAAVGGAHGQGHPAGGVGDAHRRGDGGVIDQPVGLERPAVDGHAAGRD